MVSSLKDFNNLPIAIAAFQEAKVEYLEQLGKATVRQIDIGFDKGQDALGRPWEPLKDSNGQILVDTGRMRESIDYAVDEKKLKLAVGGDVEYLRAHEFGTGKVPARPILRPALTWANKQAVKNVADEKIGETLDKFTVTSF